ncbi:hypothetical protein [uncultured Nostoc sp.]|uniref:hypothetical protein n=1 Tax=uncultured Nostoc sp. TaxID=340711 RepID=UPI0035CA03DD
MLIEDYFQEVRILIESSKIVQLFHLETEERGMYEGFIRAKLEFKDNSLLHLREFIYVEISLDIGLWTKEVVRVPTTRTNK